MERLWRKEKSALRRSNLRKQVNVYNKLISTAKNNFYTNQIENSQSNPKKLWQNINRILHRTPETILPDHVSENTLANCFATFFTEKIEKIRATFPIQSQSDLTENTNHQLRKFESVAENEVHKLIMSGASKSCPLDPWPTSLVKECLDILITPITRLMNLSLSEGIFPQDFKTAIVTPLIKKQTLPKNNFKNFRPVSNLNYISKILEKVVAAQLKKYLSVNNLNNPMQSAYREGHSTESALLSVGNEIHLDLAKGKCTALVLLDLSAAFDTIDHSILINRLSSLFGIKETVLKWLRSYLTDRKQKVKIGNSYSEDQLLNFGVPQGSVLGPLLFTMYTTPLSNVINQFHPLKHCLYADDTQIFTSLTPQTAMSTLQILKNCLTSIQTWMSANMLKLNPDKTEFLLLGNSLNRSKLSDCFPIEFLGSLVSPTEKVRNLGVLFDADF